MLQCVIIVLQWNTIHWKCLNSTPKCIHYSGNHCAKDYKSSSPNTVSTSSVNLPQGTWSSKSTSSSVPLPEAGPLTDVNKRLIQVKINERFPVNEARNLSVMNDKW